MSAPEGRAQAGAGAPLSPAQRAAERYTDGEWHRLHPATPLLRGGIVFIALFGFVLSNLREVFDAQFEPAAGHVEDRYCARISLGIDQHGIPFKIDPRRSLDEPRLTAHVSLLPPEQT